MPGPDGSPATLNQDGTVARIDLLLAGSPYSNASLALAGGELREVAHAAAPPGTQAYVGGLSSIFADVKNANDRDLWVIFPVAGLLIAVILALLLRSLVAPLYLIVAVVLGFFATLGATVIAFQGIGGRARPVVHAADHPVPVRGRDRHRLQHPDDRATTRGGAGRQRPRTAADLAIEHGGPSVGAAGLILAGTFASMMLAGISFLVEMGFAVLPRHPDLGVRDVDVPGAERHRAAGPQGVVARPRRHGAAGHRARAGATRAAPGPTDPAPGPPILALSQ